jgi:broad specificity phosphatase PhoE
MSLTLYLLRHGQTAHSRENDFCGSLDAELTPDGIAMARCFAAAYKSVPWAAVYCSPKKRTIATAAPLCEAIGQTPQIRDGLREIAYGAWEGKNVEMVDREYHDDYIRWSADPAWYPPTGGETAVTIAGRVLPVIEEIKAAHKDGNVLVVSHKATIRITLCSFLGIDVGRFRYRLGAPVGSVSVVEFSNHGPLMRALGDRTHLDERLRGLPGT